MEFKKFNKKYPAAKNNTQRRLTLSVLKFKVMCNKFTLYFFSLYVINCARIQLILININVAKGKLINKIRISYIVFII
jgi:hypothetical protein